MKSRRLISQISSSQHDKKSQANIAQPYLHGTTTTNYASQKEPVTTSIQQQSQAMMFYPGHGPSSAQHSLTQASSDPASLQSLATTQQQLHVQHQRKLKQAQVSTSLTNAAVAQDAHHQTAEKDKEKALTNRKKKRKNPQKPSNNAVQLQLSSQKQQTKQCQLSITHEEPAANIQRSLDTVQQQSQQFQAPASSWSNAITTQQKAHKSSSIVKRYMQPLKRTQKQHHLSKEQADQQLLQKQVTGEGCQLQDANAVLRSISAIQSKHPNFKIDLKHAQQIQKNQLAMAQQQHSHQTNGSNQKVYPSNLEVNSLSSTVVAQNSSVFSICLNSQNNFHNNYLEQFKSPSHLNSKQRAHFTSKMNTAAGTSRKIIHHPDNPNRTKHQLPQQQLQVDSSVPSDALFSHRSSKQESFGQQRLLASEIFIQNIINKREQQQQDRKDPKKQLPRSLNCIFPPQTSAANKIDISQVSVARQKEGQHQMLSQRQDINQAQSLLQADVSSNGGDAPDLNTRNTLRIKNMQKSIEKMRAQRQNQHSPADQIKQLIQPIAKVADQSTQELQLRNRINGDSSRLSLGCLPFIKQNTSSDKKDKQPWYEVPSKSHSPSPLGKSQNTTIDLAAQKQSEKIRQIIVDQKGSLAQSKTRQVISMKSLELQQKADKVPPIVSPLNNFRRTPINRANRPINGICQGPGRLVTNLSHETLHSGILPPTESSLTNKSQPGTTRDKSSILSTSQNFRLKALVRNNSFQRGIDKLAVDQQSLYEAAKDEKAGEKALSKLILSKKLQSRLWAAQHDKKASAPVLQEQKGINNELTSPQPRIQFNRQGFSDWQDINSQGSPKTAQFNKTGQENSQQPEATGLWTGQQAQIESHLKERLTGVDKLRKQTLDAAQRKSQAGQHKDQPSQEVADEGNQEMEQLIQLVQQSSEESAHQVFDEPPAGSMKGTDQRSQLAKQYLLQREQKQLSKCSSNSSSPQKLPNQKNATSALSKSANKKSQSLAADMMVSEYTDEEKKSSYLRQGQDCVSLPRIADCEANQISVPIFKVYKKLTTGGGTQHQHQQVKAKNQYNAVSRVASVESSQGEKLNHSNSQNYANPMAQFQLSSLESYQPQQHQFAQHLVIQPLSATGVSHNSHAQAMMLQNQRTKSFKQKSQQMQPMHNASTVIIPYGGDLQPESANLNNESSRKPLHRHANSFDSSSSKLVVKNSTISNTDIQSRKQSRLTVHSSIQNSQIKNYATAKQRQEKRVGTADNSSTVHLAVSSHNILQQSQTSNYFQVLKNGASQPQQPVLHQRTDSIRSNKAEKDMLVKHIMQNNRKQRLNSNHHTVRVKTNHIHKGSLGQATTTIQAATAETIESHRKQQSQNELLQQTSKLGPIVKHEQTTRGGLDDKTDPAKQTKIDNGSVKLSQAPQQLPKPQKSATQLLQDKFKVKRSVQEVTFSVKLLRRGQMQQRDAQSPATQSIGLCFEGVCASVSSARFAYFSQGDQIEGTGAGEAEANSGVKLRDSLQEALAQFHTATKDSILIFLYTYLSEDDPVFLSEHLREFFDQLDRIIFIKSDGQYFQKSEVCQLEMPSECFDARVKEILWVHPLGLDFNEVLFTIKAKNYERFFKNEDGVDLGTCMPQSNDPKVAQYFMLISSIEFELGTGLSASMLAIMKTIQSLYFLGKTTQLFTKRLTQRLSTDLSGKQASLVPAAIQVGLVPAPSAQSSNQIQSSALPKPLISFSWQKSFKTIKEHMLLSLVAFQAPESYFTRRNPTSILEKDKDVEMAVVREPPGPLSPKASINKGIGSKSKENSTEQLTSLRENQTNTLALPQSASQVRGLTQQSYQKQQNKVLMNFQSTSFNKKEYLAQSGIQVAEAGQLSELTPTQQVLDLVSGSSILMLTANPQAKETTQNPASIISYQQPTISSNLMALHSNMNMAHRDGTGAGLNTGEFSLSLKEHYPSQYSAQQDRQTNAMAQLTPQQQLMLLSPKNRARQFLKDLRQQNNLIARSIRAYARSKEVHSNTARKENSSSKQSNRSKPNESEITPIQKQDAAATVAPEDSGRRIIILDGWLLEKYPLISLPL